MGEPPQAKGNQVAPAPSGQQVGPGPTAGKGAQPQGDTAGVKWEQCVEPDDDIHVVPADFKALDKDVIELLDRSRTTLSAMQGKKFWPALREMAVSNLHTLVQVHKQAKAAGVWKVIARLEQIYSYSTSWGIYFQSTDNPGGLMGGDAWGKDAPQKTTQDEHHNGQNYTWYRQNTGVGNPGLHMGVGISGANHDLHIDPHNPMKAVAKGGEWTLLPKPMEKQAGEAIYSAQAITHVLEVKLGMETEAGAPTRSFIGAWGLDESRKHAQGYIDRERSVRQYTKDVKKSDQVIGWIEAVNTRITKYTDQARALAMGDDNDPAREGLDVNVKHTGKELLTLLTSLFVHMKSETPEVNAEGFDTRPPWENGTWQAYNTSVKMVEARKNKKKNEF